jgi:hypothetical protein
MVNPKINFVNACSYTHDGKRSTCMSTATLEKLKAQEHNLKLSKTIDAILAAKGKTVDELGLLLDKRVISALGSETVRKELDENFKPVGPTDWSLFNNFVENNVMRHLHKWDPTFLGLDVNLMDFQDYQGSLTNLLFREKIYCNGASYSSFGCVLNTMKMSGDLSKVGHWVALFGDFRDPNNATIEYFNSSGKASPPELHRWMGDKVDEYKKVSGKQCTALDVSNIQHQKSDTECGIYSVYFITARVCGINYKKFREMQISDDRVNKFRKNMFNDQSAVKDKSFLESNHLI